MPLQHRLSTSKQKTSSGNSFKWVSCPSPTYPNPVSCSNKFNVARLYLSWYQCAEMQQLPTQGSNTLYQDTNKVAPKRTHPMDTVFYLLAHLAQFHSFQRITIRYFKWPKDTRNQKSIEKQWDSFFLLQETLEEFNFHLLKPVWAQLRNLFVPSLAEAGARGKGKQSTKGRKGGRKQQQPQQDERTIEGHGVKDGEGMLHPSWLRVLVCVMLCENERTDYKSFVHRFIEGWCMRIQSFENMLPASFCQERMEDLPTESIVTFLSVRWLILFPTLTSFFQGL